MKDWTDKEIIKYMNEAQKALFKRTLHTKEEITPKMLKKAIKVLKQYKPKRGKPYYVQVEDPRVFHVKMFVF